MATGTSSAGKRPSLKSKIEAILYSVGQRISVQDIKRLTRRKEEEIVEALEELQRDYKQKEGSLDVVNDGEYWKFSIKNSYQGVVRKLVTETELSKSVLETLAVIAYKYPIKQSDLINIRTNKAYDHLRELESAGFISRKKYGRTNLIKLTEKFFQYFDLPEDKLKEKFQDFDSIAQAIEGHEQEARDRKEKHKQSAKDDESLEDKEARIQKEIELIDEQGREIPLQEYGRTPHRHDVDSSQLLEQKLGELAVYDEPASPKRDKDSGQDDSDDDSEADDSDSDASDDDTSDSDEVRDPFAKDDAEESEESDKDTGDNDDRPDFGFGDDADDSEDDDSADDSETDDSEEKSQDAEAAKKQAAQDAAVSRKVDQLLHPVEEKEEDDYPSAAEHKKELLAKQQEDEKEQDLLDAELHGDDKDGDAKKGSDSDDSWLSGATDDDKDDSEEDDSEDDEKDAKDPTRL